MTRKLFDAAYHYRISENFDECCHRCRHLWGNAQILERHLTGKERLPYLRNFDGIDACNAMRHEKRRIVKRGANCNHVCDLFETAIPSCATCKHGPYDCKNEVCFHCENHAFYEAKQPLNVAKV